MKVDVRVEQPDEGERLTAAFAALVPSVPGARVEILGGLNRPPMPVGAAGDLFQMALTAAAEVGVEGIEGVAVGGGSDGNFTAAVGVPTLDGMGAVGGGAHADHEFVLVDTMVPRASLVAALLGSIART